MMKEPNIECAKVDSCKDRQGPDLIANFMARIQRIEGTVNFM
jgi:hypothetical protein